MKQDIYTEEHKKLSMELARLRIKAGFSQKEVSIKIGKTQSYLSKIENGQIQVDVLLAKRLAEIYGMKIQDLVK